MRHDRIALSPKARPQPGPQPEPRIPLQEETVHDQHPVRRADFADPSLPPGFDADKINAGIAIALDKIRERGWQGTTCMITPDAAGSAMLKSALRSASYDCVVIGGGLRLPPKSLGLFETVVNLVRKAAPNAAIAFNTRPEDTAEAAARQLSSR